MPTTHCNSPLYTLHYTHKTYHLESHGLPCKKTHTHGLASLQGSNTIGMTLALDNFPLHDAACL